MLNSAQWASLARVLIIVAGGIAVGKGWATQEQVQAASSSSDVIAIVGGLIAIAASGFAALKARTATALTRTTSALPGVKAIVTDPALAQALPQRPNVVATSPEAQRVVDRVGG